MLHVICRQESCENQGLKCQRTRCEPSHTGRDVGSCAANLPRSPSHSPQTPWWPRRSNTMWCGPCSDSRYQREPSHRSVTLLCRKAPGPLHILLLNRRCLPKNCAPPLDHFLLNLSQSGLLLGLLFIRFFCLFVCLFLFCFVFQDRVSL